MRKMKLSTILSILIMGLFSAPMVFAHDDEEKEEHVHYKQAPYDWQLKLFGVEADQNGPGYYDNSSAGLGLALDFRMSRRVSLELTTIFAGNDDHYDHHHHKAARHQNDHHHDYDFDNDGMVTALGGINFHLFPRRWWDFQIGPIMGVVIQDSFDFEGSYDHDHLDLDYNGDATAVFGINLALDIPFGRDKRWALHLAAKSVGAVDDDHRYENQDWDFASIGLGYRF